MTIIRMEGKSDDLITVEIREFPIPVNKKFIAEKLLEMLDNPDTIKVVVTKMDNKMFPSTKRKASSLCYSYE